MSGLAKRADRVPDPVARPTSTAPTRSAPPSAATPPGTVTLGELLARAGEAVRVGLPAPMWVLAAVAAVKPARGGHTIELVEPDVARADAGQLRAYLPEGVVDALRRATGHAVAAADLAGMSVVLQVRCELHPRWGLSARVLALAPGIEASLAARAVEATLARLRSEGLLDKQRRLPIPRDVTRVAVVHPPDAAGWADVAGELRRWAAVGVVAVRSVPVRFEGEAAAAGLAAAVGRAAEPIDGAWPDLVLLVRGGGARAGLAPLDDEALARRIAAAPVPVITGLGHATDRTVADAVSWRRADTPSKALGLVRDLIVGPARRARADHAAALAAVSSGLDRAGPALDAMERRLAAGALRHANDASGRLDAARAAVQGEARAAREGLGRQGDGLDRLRGEVTAAAPARLDRAATALDACLDGLRHRARVACAGAEDGARDLAAVAARSAARVDAAGIEAASLHRQARAAARARVDRAAADLDVLAEAVRARARDRRASADDGARPLAAVTAAVAATRRDRDAAVERLRSTVEATLARRLDAAAAALDRTLAALDAADPAVVLRRGFALALDRAGRPLTSAEAARGAGAFTIRFGDGDVAVAVIHT